MSDRVTFFLGILRAELEDLAEDLAAIDTGLRERYERSEVTPYVYRENGALLLREQESCRELALFVDGIQGSLYKSIDEVVDVVRKGALDLVTRHEEPKAITELLGRKISKVRRYIESGDSR
ncbi:MAG: hypothetical protein JXA15_11305 [Spirochaetales bacterium]|nr:hypothetical protein [Spirochaetales bacterium]